VREVLAETTVADAVSVYEAIRLAAPTGLGAAEAQDWRQCLPSAAGRHGLAADRDSIAREYVTDFAITFELARGLRRHYMPAHLDPSGGRDVP